MANSLFNSLNAGMPSLQEQLHQLKSDPFQFLVNRRLSIPQDIQNDPQAIIQHLLNTGQMSQQRYQQLQEYIKTLPI